MAASSAMHQVPAQVAAWPYPPAHCDQLASAAALSAVLAQVQGLARQGNH